MITESSFFLGVIFFKYTLAFSLIENKPCRKIYIIFALLGKIVTGLFTYSNVFFRISVSASLGQQTLLILIASSFKAKM